MEVDRLIQLSEAAEMLGRISLRTVRRMIAAHELPPPIYIGRIPKLSLMEVVAVIERMKEQRNGASL